MIEAGSDATSIQDRFADIEVQIRDRTAEWETAKENAKRHKAMYERKEQEVSALPEEVQEYFRDLPAEAQSRSLQDLEIELDVLRARLEGLTGGDFSTIREFEARARKITDLKSQIESVDAKLIELAGIIKTKRSIFEPVLDRIVGHISRKFEASFRKINCAGQVEVYKASPEPLSSTISSAGGFSTQRNASQSHDDDDAQDEVATDTPLESEREGTDFESWSIQISVKFRENETLSVLNSQRQSGGERAVSTIFYLMALQSVSRAPFRVVDEINQGMDPRNERVVHERLVDIAVGQNMDQQQDEDEDDNENNDDDNDDRDGVGKGGSQYFLVTPKLLTGLKYAEGMMVHCIASGEFMPGDPEQMDMSRLLETARRNNNGRPSHNAVEQGARVVPVGA